MTDSSTASCNQCANDEAIISHCQPVASFLPFDGLPLLLLLPITVLLPPIPVLLPPVPVLLPDVELPLPEVGSRAHLPSDGW
jgi:hypothetical protein